MKSLGVDIICHSSDMLFVSLLLLEYKVDEEYRGDGSFGGVIALFRKFMYTGLQLQQHWLITGSLQMSEI